MFPPEGLLTVLGALIIGFCFGIANRYLISLILSVILALLVDSFAASNRPFYDFGDHLYKHLLFAVIISGTVFLIIRLLAKLFSAKQTASLNPIVGAGNSNKVAITAHSLGLLNLYPFVGCIAIAIYWAFNRSAEPAKVEQIKEAFQFQVTYFAAFLGFACLVGEIPRNSFAWLFSLSMLLMLSWLTWLVLTITAIFKTSRTGSFQYPMTVRFLDLLYLLPGKRA